MDDVTLKNRVKGINWNTAVFMALFHVGAVAALFVFNWKAVLVAILLWWVAGSLGVGIGFTDSLVSLAQRRRAVGTQ